MLAVHWGALGCSGLGWTQLRAVHWAVRDLDAVTGSALGCYGLGHSYGRCVGIFGTWTQLRKVCWGVRDLDAVTEGVWGCVGVLVTWHVRVMGCLGSSKSCESCDRSRDVQRGQGLEGVGLVMLWVIKLSESCAVWGGHVICGGEHVTCVTLHTGHG